MGIAQPTFLWNSYNLGHKKAEIFHLLSYCLAFTHHCICNINLYKQVRLYDFSVTLKNTKYCFTFCVSRIYKFTNLHSNLQFTNLHIIISLAIIIRQKTQKWKNNIKIFRFPKTNLPHRFETAFHEVHQHVYHPWFPLCMSHKS